MRDDAHADHPASLSRAWFIAALVFVALLSSLRTPPTTDANDHVYLADSFLRYGSVDLSRYRAEFFPFHGYPLDGRVVSAYTAGAALLFVPFAAVAAVLGWDAGSFPTAGVLARLAATLWVSVATACIYLTLRPLVAEGHALLFAFALAFATAAHSIASQVYFQHAPSVGLLAIGVMGLLRGGPRWIAIAGLALGTAVIVRQQNALLVLGLALFAIDRRRGDVLRLALWAIPPLVFQAAYGLAVNGNPLPLPASVQRLGDPLLGLPGLFISPSRGLLIGAPFLAVALLALAASWRWRPTDPVVLARYGSLGLAASAVLFASVGDWWGGHSYGNRYLIDALPLYAVGLALASQHGWLRTALRRWVFAAAVAWAVAFHTIGAAGYYTPEGWAWERVPEIDLHPARLWSWTDPQWLAVLRGAATEHLAVLLVHSAVLVFAAAVFAWLARIPVRPAR